MPGRKRYDYAGSVTGSCGHICGAWPIIKKDGKSHVICDTCDEWVVIRQPDTQLALFDMPESWGEIGGP